MNRREKDTRFKIDLIGLFVFALIVAAFFVFVGSAQSAPLPPHQGHPILPVSAAEAKREKALRKDWLAQRTAQHVSRDRAQLRLVLKRAQP